MRRLRVLSVLLLAPLVAVSACGGGTEEKKLSPIATASSKPTPTPSALPTTREEAKGLHQVELGKNAARTDEEKAVVKAYLTYWQAVSDAYFDVEPPPELARSTGGEAAITVLTHVAELKSKKEREVGWTRSNVLEVNVSGTSATVQDCIENFSFTVDADDKPIEVPKPFFSSTSKLTEKDGNWMVMDTSAKIEKKSCLR